VAVMFEFEAQALETVLTLESVISIQLTASAVFGNNVPHPVRSC
jgi:hypothetical protein